MQTKTEFVICGAELNTRQAMIEFSMDKHEIQPQNVHVAHSLGTALQMYPSDTPLNTVKMCIPFMTEETHIDWGKLQDYLSGELFYRVDAPLREELDKPVNVNLFYQLVESAELEKRVIAR